VKHSFAASVKLKSEFEKKINQQVAAVDDADLLALSEKYAGAMLYDKDDGLYYKVLDVNFMPHCGNDYWMATSIPVVSVGGAWIVEDKHLARTSRVPTAEEEAGAAPRKVVYLHSSLEYFSLARVHGPNEVSFHGDVDVMMADFEVRDGRL